MPVPRGVAAYARVLFVLAMAGCHADVSRSDPRGSAPPSGAWVTLRNVSFRTPDGYRRSDEQADEASDLSILRLLVDGEGTAASSRDTL